MIFKNFADQDWTGFNFIEQDWTRTEKFHSPPISAKNELCLEIRYVIVVANLGVILHSNLVFWSYLYRIRQGLLHRCCQFMNLIVFARHSDIVCYFLA